MQDVSWSELPVINSLLWSLFIYDCFVTIVQMLLGLMGKHTLKRFNLVCVARSLNVGSHHLIGILWFDSPCCCLEGLPSSHQYIGLLALGLSSDDETVGTRGWEAIDMSTQVDLD